MFVPQLLISYIFLEIYFSAHVMMDEIKKEVEENIKFESSSDEYMCEVDAELQDLSEDENFHNPDQEILAASQRKDLREIYSSDSEDKYSTNAISFMNESDESFWVDVTKEDNYNYNINFSTGENNIGPVVPPNCTTPLHFFQLFFTDDLIKRIVLETNAYAANIIQRKKLSTHSIWKQWKNVTECEMKAFLGVIINMGLINMPNLQDYWARNFYSKIPFFSKIFSRDRFMQIFLALRLETLPKSNTNMKPKARKISIYLDFLNNKFMEHYIPKKNLSINESTVGFKGRISFRTYNPQKPTKLGIRLYLLADSQTSYLYSLFPYYGKITTKGLIRPDLSFASRIVLQLYNNLQKSIPGATGYHIFTDKFYTNPILATELLKQQCFLTGTMTNKKGIPRRIKKPKLAIGQGIAYRKENTLILAWRQKKVITMLSTKHKSGMMTRAKKKFSMESNIEKQFVTKPIVIFDYIDNMSGVDTADQYSVSYCFIRKTLKWWRKLFFWGFESAIVNSYILYKECTIKNNDTPITHLQFRKKLLMELIGDFRAAKLRPGPESESDREQRLENISHFIFQLSGSKTKDCQVCSKPNVPGERKRTSFFCDTCERKPGLHPGNCFKRYHTLKKYKM